MIRALRLEIGHPIEMTWDELGTMLRTQRKIMAQLLQAGMSARIACAVVTTAKVKAHLAPDVRGSSASTMIYQAMKTELAKIQAGKWRDEQRPALDLCGGMLSALAQRVAQNYGKRSGYQSAQPIPVRKQETKLFVTEDGAVILELKLAAGGRVRLSVRAGKGSAWSTLRGIAIGELAHGDCKLVYDEDRRKWYALLSYTPAEPEPLTVSPERALIVHRGARNALYLMSTTGHVRAVSGAKLLHQLGGIEIRLRETKRVSGSELGAGAKGHGKRRRYEHYEKLSGVRDRLVKTWCQQQAAFTIRCAREFGCALIVIEEYGGIGPSEDTHVRRALIRFPMFRLKEALKHAAESAGMSIQEVPSEYISTTCPRCSNADFRQHNHRTGIFHCAACALERPADFVAALHMLRRSKADSSVWDERMRKLEQVREAITAKGAL